MPKGLAVPKIKMGKDKIKMMGKDKIEMMGKGEIKIMG